MSEVPQPYSRSPSRRLGRLSATGTVSRCPAITTRCAGAEVGPRHDRVAVALDGEMRLAAQRRLDLVGEPGLAARGRRHVDDRSGQCVGGQAQVDHGVHRRLTAVAIARRIRRRGGSGDVRRRPVGCSTPGSRIPASAPSRWCPAVALKPADRRAPRGQGRADRDPHRLARRRRRSTPPTSTCGCTCSRTG